jgi:hypothetical protein
VTRQRGQARYPSVLRYSPSPRSDRSGRSTCLSQGSAHARASRPWTHVLQGIPPLNRRNFHRQPIRRLPLRSSSLRPAKPSTRLRALPTRQGCCTGPGLVFPASKTRSPLVKQR